MIELVSADRCIACDRCIKVCPTDVFDRGPDGIPVIARHADCQTCFHCEANCPVDALFVAPTTHRSPQDEQQLADAGLLGSYRALIGWGHGRTPGSLLAVGPTLGTAPITS
ncbi:4Fe-4S dicluster domain-containing protein [Kitasatospora sp. NBC_01539]|uniref:4Fe-4S dicluster domain-containing protein n=1 Tax=Kitasatospora sp. NBC_01539 TaxID=2903577 RepID=UPI0038600EB6